MKRHARTLLIAALCAACALLSVRAQQPATAPAVRFATVDVLIDSREPLAAWQFELSERNGLMTVVGVENGDSPAFARPPYYDLAAVQQGSADRIIVADFSLEPGPDLPVGTTRIATIHVRLSGSGDPDYQLRLIAAGDATGRAIEAAISLDNQ